MVAVIQRDDHAAMREIQAVDADQIGEDVVMALAEVFRANFVRKAAELGKPDVADHITAVTKKHTASLALACAHFRVARPAQAVDWISETFPRLPNPFVLPLCIGAQRAY